MPRNLIACCYTLREYTLSLQRVRTDQTDDCFFWTKYINSSFLLTTVHFKISQTSSERKKPSFSMLVLLNWSFNLASWVSSKKMFFSWIMIFTFSSGKLVGFHPLTATCPFFSSVLPSWSCNFEVSILQKVASLFDVTMNYLQATTNSHLFEDFSPSTLKPCVIWVMLLIL